MAGGHCISICGIGGGGDPKIGGGVAEMSGDVSKQAGGVACGDGGNCIDISESKGGLNCGETTQSKCLATVTAARQLWGPVATAAESAAAR